MRWIDEIEPAYSRYAATLQDGYDTHAPVQSNERLAPILASLPWPNTLPPPSSSPSAPLVTLDTLFTLPVVRVAYYQRLYAKLLRSTQEGRSDHALLVSANDKLRRLAAMCDDAQARSLDGDVVGTTRPLVLAPAVPVVPAPAQSSSRSEERGAEARRPGGGAPPPPRLELDLGRDVHERGSDRGSGSGGGSAGGGAGGGGGSAGLDSPSSSSYRSSGATGISTANTSAIHGGGYAAASPLRVEDLEHRLDPSRALDIFTMKPRVRPSSPLYLFLSSRTN